jgi:hypothetical protein
MSAALRASTVETAILLVVRGDGGHGRRKRVAGRHVDGRGDEAMSLSNRMAALLPAALVWSLLGIGAVVLAEDHHKKAHPNDPVKQEEHSAMFELVDDRDATYVAVASGDWGDIKTWDKKSVPGAGARVIIPKGKTILVAGTHDGDRLDWLRVDGTLRFDPKADTSLKVVTLIGNVGSTIEIGTENERIQSGKRARLILGDRGERNKALRQRDPYDLSGGLLSHGQVRIFGAEYTSHSTPTAVPKKGDSEVSFAKAPLGWKVGDRLLFPGLDRQRMGQKSIDPWTGREMPTGEHQDEEREVRSLSKDGRTVTLDRALVYQHGGIYGFAGPVPVGNLSRNVIIESEIVQEVSRRGHVMFMHAQDVIIDGALFRELGRTHVVGILTSPEVKDCELVAGTDANTIGRYAVHFHIRWGATLKQEPFRVRNCAVVGSPKLGIVNHGGYGLVDNNVSYRVRGSHFFTENGSEIGRFTGNLAVRSDGTDGDDDGLPIPPHKGYAGHPLNIGHGGHGFWLQGGGVDVTDNIAIGHSYSAFGFFVANNRIISYGGPQERHNPATKGTPYEKFDVFLAVNLKDPRLAHGKAFVHTSAVPFHAARCVGLASAVGLRTRGIDRTEFLVMHGQQDVVEDCQFVNNGRGYDLGYSPGLTILRKTTFIGTDPSKGGLDSFGIGGFNHIAGFLHLEEVTIDGYRTGCALPPRGIHTIKGGSINGIRKLVVPCPWGGKLTVTDVKFGTMKGENAQPILFGADPTGPWLYGVPPYSNWTRKFQPFELVYNGKQVYHDDQKADAIPFDSKAKRWADKTYGNLHHGVLDGLTSQQLWDRYRLAIGGRLAPAKLTPCPDIEGGYFGADVPFEPALESEPSTAYYGGKRYEALFGKASRDDVPMQPRYLYDPIHVQTPQKGYVARMRVEGKEYQSAPIDLKPGLNLVPITIDRETRYVVVGSPNRERPYKQGTK